MFGNDRNGLESFNRRPGCRRRSAHVVTGHRLPWASAAQEGGAWHKKNGPRRFGKSFCSDRIVLLEIRTPEVGLRVNTTLYRTLRRFRRERMQRSRGRTKISVIRFWSTSRWIQTLGHTRKVLEVGSFEKCPFRAFSVGRYEK